MRIARHLIAVLAIAAATLSAATAPAYADDGSGLDNIGGLLSQLVSGLL
ncbi:hypothetical protein ACGFNU_39240 [Spirillospora sp. NPDC048911]